MSFLSRLLGTQADPRDELRPLWFRVVELSRLPEYYAQCGVADTINGRFDMVTAVLALTMLRMEKSRSLRSKSALLTELYVDDMEAQLREDGVGDVVVGKRMGKLMGALGGRMGAFRKALDSKDGGAFADALQRNVTWAEGVDEPAMAASLSARLESLFAQLGKSSDSDLLSGDFVK